MISRPETKTIGRFIGLGLVTAMAMAVMWATGFRSAEPPVRLSAPTRISDAETLNAAAPVVVQELTPMPIAVLDTYSGMLRPYERYSVAFEMPGRIRELGQHETGRDLDEGDRVKQGQVLAVLDRRVLEARLRETSAVLEQAQQELDRARQMRQSPSRPISETEFQRRVTDLAVATAQAEQAAKNLEDATLLSPCDGTVSRRNVNAGESIGMHQLAFEIVQLDRVLLVVGVPESRVQEIVNRWRSLRDAMPPSAKPAVHGIPRPDEFAPFTVHVELMGTDRFGKPWPARSGRMFRIAETADTTTGLFEVEVLIDNPDGSLKPGLVALGKIVIDEFVGFRIPVDSVMFRGQTPYVYAVHESPADLTVMFWNVGPAPDFRAHQVELPRYVEQDRELVLPALADRDRRIVVRGQHRLVEGRRVRLVDANHDRTAQRSATATRQ